VGLVGCASPLARPAVTGDVATARRLLDEGHSPDSTDRKRRSALELAVLKQRTEMVRLLLERGANPNIVGPYRKTPLQHAAQRGTGPIAELLIKAGANMNVLGRCQAPPLFDAIYANKTDVAEVLIRSGANLDTTEPKRSGGTALHAAIRRKNTEIAQLLIKAGADTSLRDLRGQTPAQLAYQTGLRQIASLIDPGPSRRATPGPMRPMSADGRDPATARRLLDTGVNPDSTDRRGRTALEVAVLKRQTETVRDLIERGANPNIVGPYRKTPLQHTAERGTGPIAELLIKAGADMSVLGRYRAPPLIDAIYTNQTEVAEALIRGGANLDMTEPKRSGGTALHAAIQKKNTRIARLLIEAGADTGLLDRRGRTPAQLASRMRQEQIARLIESRPSGAPRPSGPVVLEHAETAPPRIAGPRSVRTEAASVNFQLWVSDDSEISEARIEGDPLTVAADGRVEVRRAVPEGGSSLLFEVVDEWGNKAHREIAVTRTETATARRGSTSPPETQLAEVDFGNYHALVIGNDDYSILPSLLTPVNDARRISEVLKQRYGFQVTTLENATRSDILSALSRYRRQLTRRDNLLIYYAGHGWLDQEADQGYWLPINATPEDEVNWVANSSVTGKVRAMKAKHVLLVADSCFSGKLTRGVHIKHRDPEYLRRIIDRRARVVLTSGGLEPVADSGGKRGHSVFASAFLDALEQNQGLLEGHELFTQIRRPVAVNSDQIPEYSDLRKAGHDGGDFLFIRRK
jgi:ankyrin repeat protein